MTQFIVSYGITNTYTLPPLPFFLFFLPFPTSLISCRLISASACLIAIFAVTHESIARAYFWTKVIGNHLWIAMNPQQVVQGLREILVLGFINFYKRKVLAK